MKVYKTVQIYTLSDPETGLVRYVGKAINAEARLNAHLKDKSTTHKVNWIKGLKKKGLKPVVNVIENVGVEEWQFAERFWIETLTSLGCILTNLDSGGIGAKVMSKESCKKLSRSLRKSKVFRNWITSEALRESTRRTHLGRKRSPETCQRIKNRPVSDSLRKKVGDFHRGRKRSKETCQRLKVAAKLRPQSYWDNLRNKLQSNEVRERIRRKVKAIWRKRKKEGINIMEHLRGKKKSKKHCLAMRRGWAARKERLLQNA